MDASSYSDEPAGVSRQVAGGQNGALSDAHLRTARGVLRQTLEEDQEESPVLFFKRNFE